MSRLSAITICNATLLACAALTLDGCDDAGGRPTSSASRAVARTRVVCPIPSRVPRRTVGAPDLAVPGVRRMFGAQGPAAARRPSRSPPTMTSTAALDRDDAHAALPREVLLERALTELRRSWWETPDEAGRELLARGAAALGADALDPVSYTHLRAHET